MDLRSQLSIQVETRHGLSRPVGVYEGLCIGSLPPGEQDLERKEYGNPKEGTTEWGSLGLGGVGFSSHLGKLVGLITTQTFQNHSIKELFLKLYIPSPSNLRSIPQRRGSGGSWHLHERY